MRQSEFTSNIMLSQTPNLMIDIETFGVTEDAHILSIGVCSFSLIEGYIETVANFHLGLVEQNRKIDASTIQFWLAQPREAMDQALTIDITLRQALERLVKSIDAVSNNGARDINIWCNGASFDFAIMKNAFKQYNINTPWKYYQENCMRAIKALLTKNDLASITAITNERMKAKQLVGLAHDALSDAIWQSEFVAAAIKFLRS